MPIAATTAPTDNRLRFEIISMTTIVPQVSNIRWG